MSDPKKKVQNLWRLDGKVAIVTGAGGGLGAEIARTLASVGAHVVCADLDATVAHSSALAAAKCGSADSSALDVTDRESVFDLVHSTVDRYGQLDVMCNLAGIAGESERIEDLTEAHFDKMFAVHFKGVLYGCQAAIGAMKTRGSGSIINMSSAAIDIAPPTIASYAVSKAAVSMLTRVLAAEVGKYGIRANVLAPSLIPTDLSMKRYTDEGARQQYLQSWADKAPLGRVGTAEDIAAQVLYLASDNAGFVTGQTLRANGGLTMPW